MKMRVIIWAIINLTVIGLIVVYPELRTTPLWLIIVFSQFILKTRKQLKTECNQKVSIKQAILMFSLIGLIILLGVLGHISGFNEWSDKNPVFIRTLWSILGIAVIVIAFKRLFMSPKNIKQLND